MVKDVYCMIEVFLLLCNRGQVLEALMQQKASGKIPGILGRLVSDPTRKFTLIAVCCVSRYQI